MSDRAAYFIECCYYGRFEEVERLLTHGDVDDIDVRDEDGCTGLHLAIGERYRCVVDLLVAHGPDFALKDAVGYSAFHWAILAGEAYYLDLVFQRHNAINEPDIGGHLPIHLAIVHRERRSLEWLLDHEVCVDAGDRLGWTALHHCAGADLVALASLLLDAGASIESLNKAGETPLDVARRSGSDGLVEILASRGQDGGS